MSDQMTGTTKRLILSTGCNILSIIELSVDSIITSDLYRHVLVIITLIYAKQVHNDKVKLFNEIHFAIPFSIPFWLLVMSLEN